MLIVMRDDLVRVMKEAEFVKAFGALDYMVVLDTDVNETVQMANQVLPIGAYPETDGSFTNFKGRVQRISQAFPPPGKALTGIEAIARLGHAIDGVERVANADAVFAQIAASEPAFSGMSFDALMPHGIDLKTI
jgi:NADH-quinone oxidoreductase subunit G